MLRGDALEIIFKVRFPGWPRMRSREALRSPEASGAGADALVTDGEADGR